MSKRIIYDLTIPIEVTITRKELGVNAFALAVIEAAILRETHVDFSEYGTEISFSARSVKSECRVVRRATAKRTAAKARG